MNTVVLKFGGTSVADNDKLKIVADKIIELKNLNNDVVVVVSAQGKTTDRLLKEAYELSGNPSNRELDVLLSTGEQVSISKLSILLNQLGYDAIALTGWQAGIYTNNTNQDAIIEHIDSSRIISELSKGRIVIVAGFQGVNECLDITTLGRGGSDTTAVSIAAALDAECCYIYSDVEGVFTSDPRKLPTAIKLAEVSYDEMLDISNEGAKVLHNRCIELGKKFNIPIIAKSTFKDDEGTIVNNKIESQKVKSLVKNDELTFAQIKKTNKMEVFDLYKVLIENEIMPIEFIDNVYEIRVLLKNADVRKFEHVLSDVLYDCFVNSKKVSRVSIIGYGITNDTNIINRIINLVEADSKAVQKIDINNGKIRLTFNTVIGNELLESLHKELIR